MVRVVEGLERIALGQGDDGSPASPPIPWPARVNAAKEYLSAAGLGRGAHAPLPALPARPTPAREAEPPVSREDLLEGRDADG